MTAELDRFRLRGRLDTGDVLGHLLNSLEVETLAARLDDRSRQFWRKTGDEP
ncbi:MULTISPECIES: hypothetical protein [Streptomyces]|uniref:hypothetical protein n=1 Tax=Streptomyces TaxID=1883 RepID=UPI0029C45119|nr:hypothetical protein [Streptomyces sp. ID01-9D]MDX5572379.1 hypothetical protein [Streptomyces sp. ID01-9D]